MKIYESIFHWKGGIARNCQAPGRVHICIRWVSLPVRPLPLQWPALLRVILFARTCLQHSRLPIPPKAVCRLAFSHLSTALPGHAFAPLSATGQGFGQAGRTPEKYICFNKCAGMHSGVRAFTPKPRAPPRLSDLDRNFLKARALAAHGLCLFCLHQLLQDLFIFLSMKV